MTIIDCCISLKPNKKNFGCVGSCGYTLASVKMTRHRGAVEAGHMMDTGRMNNGMSGFRRLENWFTLRHFSKVMF